MSTCNSSAVGADYRLSTKTMVYGHYTRFDGDLMLADMKQDLNDNIFTLVYALILNRLIN